LDAHFEHPVICPLNIFLSQALELAFYF
jgi:hypothetical protein